MVESHLIQLPEGHEIPARVSEITGIRSTDLASARPLGDVYTELLARTKEVAGALIHYAQFERAFLIDCQRRLSGELALPFPGVCVHALCKRLFPDLPSQNIRGATGFFGNPVGNLKRAASHVVATHQIWRGLIPRLEELGIKTVSDLETFLTEKPKRKMARPRYAYRLDKVKRLQLPDCPGVYRMVAKSGEILYVGKATSLKSRVNSYFRGQKGRDTRKLEMLSQVWDLDVTPCATPLEAALLETDEIKRHNPPYNVVMKKGRRHLVFYARDFSSSQRTQDHAHPVGPFRNHNWIEHLRALQRSLATGHFEQIFFDVIPEETLRNAFSLYCAQTGLAPVQISHVRPMLAHGLALHRNYEEPEETADEESEEEDEAPRVFTIEEVAGKYERLFRRAGAEYRRGRRMTRLLNARITLAERGSLVFQRGRLSSGDPVEHPEFPWQDLDIETYDRMSVLLSELDKYVHQIGPV